MKKYKIYEDDGLVIYNKEEVYIGEHADIGDELIRVALVGYLKFAEMIKTKKDKERFWKEVEKNFLLELKDVKNLK